MRDFNTAYPDSPNLDPYKRVNYTNGLVLGADEFKQEELYLLEKNRLHNRALHGYGTVCGLDVSQKLTTDGPKIMVGPGIAINPSGKNIRIPEAQCATLNVWLERNKDKIETNLGSPPQELTLYLVLCHRRCLTDNVPIPSKPCVSLEENSVPSRIADHFELSFELTPPDDTEDKMVTELIELLSQIEITDEGTDFMEQEDIESLVRDLSKPTSFPVSYSFPMRMQPSQAKELLDAAFRVWVTEVRPGLLATNGNSGCGPPKENCVLLAEITLNIEEIESQFRVLGDEVKINENNRPYLLHTRLLQEYLNKCHSQSTATGITPSPSTSLIDESKIMHLAGDEVAAGQKTFTEPMLFNGNGKFEKRITLTPSLGTPLDPKTVSLANYRFLSVLRFEHLGEAAFTIPIPDDLDSTPLPDQPVDFQIRLHWTFVFATPSPPIPRPQGNFKIGWSIWNRFTMPNNILDNNFRGGSLGFKRALMQNQESRLLVTNFDKLRVPFTVARDNVYGALRIRASVLTRNFIPFVRILLLKAEISYIANRLGR